MRYRRTTPSAYIHIAAEMLVWGKKKIRKDGHRLRPHADKNAGGNFFSFPEHPPSDDVVGGGGEGCARRDVHARGDGAHRRRRRGRSRRGWCAAGTAES